MRPPSNVDAFEVLCLQAADEGRGEELFGNSIARARSAVAPFILPGEFPSVYLEFPLMGEPFVDVTVLYGGIEPGARIASDAVGDVGPLIDWYSQAREEHDDITFGFELDTKEATLPKAAIHFQPRKNTQLVAPFCELVGEPERAVLYEQTDARMPSGWSLSFFGMFRGRPNSPLRVCGYLSREETTACATDESRLKGVFDTVGFAAYDDAMLAQVRACMAVAQRDVDFQFDVRSDGAMGDTFAIDLRFGIEQPHAVRTSYKTGQARRVLGLFEELGAADERWRSSAGMAFARALPVELDDGSLGRYSFVLMPQWVKVRWRDGVLQPSKLYALGTAGLIDAGNT
ncbi:MAG: hypothetical protein J6S63_08110 [Atopobiaceae bacterium]|nr:hypothetical protein [Atopobiaceae bacterium]